MQRPKQRPSPQRRPLEKLLPVVLIVLVGTVGWRLWQRASSPTKLLEQARQALEEKNYTAAEDICRQVLSGRPQSTEALLLAGKAAKEQDRLTDALAYYDSVTSDAGQEAASARSAAGDIWLEIGHASKAEAKYREALAIRPHDAFAHERLALLLTAENRRFESLPHIYELLRQRHASRYMLVLAGEHAQTVEMPKELARFLAAAPDDPAPLIGLARIEMYHKNYVKAAGMLRQVIAAAPNYIEAHALLGRVLLEATSGDDELADWAAALPPEANAHPDVWVVRGAWARRRGQIEAAARSFWEALRRDANHQSATLQLSQMLQALGEPELAENLAARGAVLSEFSGLMTTLFEHRRDGKKLFRAARGAEALGRLWEAWSWNQAALSALGDVPWAREGLARLEPRLNDSLPLTLPEVDVGIQLDLSHYPLPFDQRPVAAIAGEQPEVGASSPRFEDVVGSVGIDFSYFCGREAPDPRARMFEFTGGGIAVVDYDLDGWPDLYFTQGCRWPPRAGQTEFLDRFYRNLGNGRFDDETLASSLGDDRFSQGATVGDFNSDGFADLYVANIGVNRLYMNNGDGTFADVSEAAGISADRWTTSCLLADLNSDGLPDLYDVNYVQGRGVFDRTCAVNGEPRACQPTLFEPAPDGFYLNLGDGRFEEMTGPAGMRAQRGNGLGIVAADFGGNGRLNVFVANDQDGNFYFVNRGLAAGELPPKLPRFEERAVLAGLAFDGNGKATACMGVAAGDADGDGKLDLLVTNFSEEANALYVQHDEESFADTSGPAGLAAPSFAMLGFGTQFLDGELDGLPDLVVTNGHVYEFAAPGRLDAMPPQYFRNLGTGRFKEVPAESLGDYFQHVYFGRGLVRLDWNRDGREDFAVSALEAPATLVTNQTRPAGHFLAVQLRGVQSSRDAIGAVVTLQIGNRRQRQWLCAGDGYLASNQRQLIFGLGASTRVDLLQIAWPSGIVQKFHDLAADQELVFIENSSLVTTLPR